MDIVIEMLRYGKNNLSGFSQDELKNHLTNIGFDLTDNNINGTISLYFGEYFMNNTAQSQTYFMNPKGYFDLLNFEATEQSRKFAKQANRFAIWAIVISAFLSISSIFISLKNDSVKIEEGQFKKINTLIEESNSNKSQEIEIVKDTIK
jgi:Na+/melibiose symporter-like transporter